MPTMDTARPPSAPVAVDASAPASNRPIEPDDLGELLASVNTVTRQLTKTHASLKRQVARLQEELTAANAQLRRSQSLAALGEMAAGIAHEVRNPLASIQLYVQLLREDVADREEARKTCDKIGRAIESLDAIVNDVLAFARETRPDARPIAVASLLPRALANCESLLAARGVRVIADAVDESLRIEGDANLLVQALTNVVRNAAEAMDETPEAERVLRASARVARRRGSDGRSRERVLVAVEDEGPGVPPEIVERMFNPFFTTRPTGTGLGLAIVHRIVDAHGGEIEVVNRPGRGARVEMWLPLPDAAAEPQAASDVRVTPAAADAA